MAMERRQTRLSREAGQQIDLTQYERGLHFLRVDVAAALADIPIFVINAPYAMHICVVYTVCTANNALGTVTLRDTAGGGGNAITDAMACAVIDTLTPAINIIQAFATIPFGGSLYANKNGAGDQGIVYMLVESV